MSVAPGSLSKKYDTGDRQAAAITARADLYFFSRWMFLQRRGFKWQRANHHKMICDALMRVFRGECKRLIINIPPRYSKTELAVVNFMAWAFGHVPDAEFIHTSYSGTLAINNSTAVRSLVQHDAYAEIFPDMALASDAQHHWKTTAGGVMYATGTGGTITGFGAGKLREGFGGCFPVGTRVWTEAGLLPIDRMVRERIAVKVWSFDYAGKMVLRPVTAWHENPPNAIVRVTFDDGASVECTPDHQFWTEGRGWVRADSLSVDDRLPCIHSGVESLDDVSVHANGIGGRPDTATVLATGASRPVGDREFGLRLGEFGPQVSLASALVDNFRAASDGLPCVAAPDLVNDSRSHSVAHSQILSSNADGVVDGECPIVGEDCDRVHLGLAESPMVLAVDDICCSGVVPDVVEPVIAGIAVSVANIAASRLIADEGSHHQLVDVEDYRLGISGQTDSKVPFAVVAGLENFPGLNVGMPAACVGDQAAFAAHATVVADRVEPFIAGNRQPVLVEYVRHDESTFCLTVDDYHNFTVESGLVVKNCIIIDDPHKADEATSDTVRKGVIDWFQNTLESRKNSPDTPIILIMQRLHQNDLAGWLLGGGNGEKWEHLKLSAWNDDGTPLWPEKHTAEVLRLMEKASPYVFAGQYRQEPAPSGGAIFKPDAMQVIDAVPVGTRFVRGWDLAATQGGGDWTAGVKIGWMPDGRYLIAHSNRFQGGPHEVKTTLVNTAQLDGPECRVRLPQDPGQAGKAQAASLIGALAGYPATSKPVTGDKTTRASPLAAQVNVGNVLMLRGGWNAEFVEELRMFPAGTHDDQVDAASDAFNELAGPSDFGLVDFAEAELRRMGKL